MKKIIQTTSIAALCLLAPFVATAQEISQPTNFTPNAVGEFYSHLGKKMWELNAVKAKDLESIKPKVIGTTFLTNDWATGTLYITSNRKVENQPFKYDIENNLFLLKDEEDTESGISDAYTIINGVIVLAFEIQDPVSGTKRFLSSNNSGYTKNGVPALGFLEILADGDISLYLKTETSILKANYNMALNVGEKEDRVVKEKVYLLKKKSENELFQINKNKRSNLAFFSDRQAEVNNYLKQNNLKLTREEDLIQLVTYYNSLK